MWLAVFAIVGLALRVEYVLDQQHVLVGGDGFHYLASADLAGDGKWFEYPIPPNGPDAHHPPLWNVVLNTVATLGGNLQSYQFTAVAIGTLTVVLVGLAGRKIAGERVGLVAAALCAIYPGAWKYERELLSEVLLLPLIAIMLLLTYWYRDRPSLSRFLALSGVCTLLTLTRAEQTGLFVFLLVPLVLATRTVDWKRRVGWLAAGAGLAVLLVAPWAVFNTARFREPVILSTGLGTTMNAGTCDATFSGDLLGHYSADQCNYRHYGLLKDLDRSELDLHMRRVSLDYSRDHVTELPRVVAARVARTFSLYRPSQEVELGSQWNSTAPWVGYGWTYMYWVLLPFAVAGVVVLRRRRIPVYPLLVEFLIVAIAAATTFGLIRYRAASEVPLLILAAAGIDGAWTWLTTRRRRQTVEDSEPRDEALVAG